MTHVCIIVLRDVFVITNKSCYLLILLYNILMLIKLYQKNTNLFYNFVFRNTDIDIYNRKILLSIPYRERKHKFRIKKTILIFSNKFKWTEYTVDPFELLRTQSSIT